MLATDLRGPGRALPVRLALVIAVLFGLALAVDCAGDGHGSREALAVVGVELVSHAAGHHIDNGLARTPAPRHGVPVDLAALCLTVTLAVLVWAARLWFGGGLAGLSSPPDRPGRLPGVAVLAGRKPVLRV